MSNLSKKPLIPTIVATATLLVSLFSYAEADANKVDSTPVKVDTVTEMKLATTTNLIGTLHSQAHVAVTAGVSAKISPVIGSIAIAIPESASNFSA